MTLREPATCWYCIGEACAQCDGFPDKLAVCDHDVIDRHEGAGCADEMPA